MTTEQAAEIIKQLASLNTKVFLLPAMLLFWGLVFSFVVQAITKKR